MTRIHDNRARNAGGSDADPGLGKSPTASVKSGDIPKLLVSVRNQSEISAALAAGVDIIDLKEPRRGALAPADVDLWRHAASIWNQLRSTQSRAAVPSFSAALGERSDAIRVARHLPKELEFAKVGPSGCNKLERIRDLWAELNDQMDDQIELVAVAYADFQNAGCLPPEAIFQAAIQSGLRRCLIDTYSKDGRSTLDHLGLDQLKGLNQIARDGGLWWALAGSIDHRCVSELWGYGIRPDCFGVRGDVCDRGRTGKLSNDRIQLWKESLQLQSAS